jgi:hypothetical protein
VSLLKNGLLAIEMRRKSPLRQLFAPYARAGDRPALDNFPPLQKIHPTLQLRMILL